MPTLELSNIVILAGPPVNPRFGRLGTVNRSRGDGHAPGPLPSSPCSQAIRFVDSPIRGNGRVRAGSSPGPCDSHLVPILGLEDEGRRSCLKRMADLGIVFRPTPPWLLNVNSRNNFAAGCGSCLAWIGRRCDPFQLSTYPPMANTTYSATRIAPAHRGTLFVSMNPETTTTVARHMGR